MRFIHYYPMGLCHPVQSGADLVASNQLDYFGRRGWEVDCVAGMNSGKPWLEREFRRRFPWVNRISKLDVPWCPHNSFRAQCLFYASRGVSQRWRRFVATPPDVFFTNYIFTAGLAQALPVSCRRVVETIDIMSHSFAAGEGYDLPPDNDDGRRATIGARREFNFRVEMDLLRLFDRILMISHDEEDVVRSNFPDPARVCHVGQTLPIEGPVTPAAGQDIDLLFVGSLHHPNIEGFRWFYRNVYLPRLRSKGLRLCVVGGVCKAIDFEDCYLTKCPWSDGRLDGYYARARAVIIPVFQGTGVSIKTIEAMGMGCPILTTPVGARGLRGVEDSLVVKDMRADPAGTARAVTELLADGDRRERLRRAARAYYEANHSRERYFVAMDAALGVRPAA